jgi:hypothetical protein
VNQTGILRDMAIIYALIAVILTYAWIRGIVEPTPAALELQRLARIDYESSAEHRRAAAARDRAAYLNQVAAAARRERERQEHAQQEVLHRDGTDGVA